jgi:SAM-dependent methyltransferase
MKPPWNNTIQYHELVLRSLPEDCRSVLDAGCGEGLLARRLADVVPRVVGLDRDAGILAGARSTTSAVGWVQGDLLAPPFGTGTFDAVVATAVLHHVDAGAGLRRLAGLVRPGGVLIVLGLAASRWPQDLPRDALGAVASRMYRSRRGLYPQLAPMVWPPPVTYAEMRRTTAAVLPGAEFRRLLLLRYLIRWRRPTTPYEDA